MRVLRTPDSIVDCDVDPLTNVGMTPVTGVMTFLPDTQART